MEENDSPLPITMRLVHSEGDGHYITDDDAGLYDGVSPLIFDETFDEFDEAALEARSFGTHSPNKDQLENAFEILEPTLRIHAANSRSFASLSSFGRRTNLYVTMYPVPATGWFVVYGGPLQGWFFCKKMIRKIVRHFGMDPMAEDLRFFVEVFDPFDFWEQRPKEGCRGL